ncbi:hypothetical protein SteCoe_17886 [Stentor coeruleus]|uniref:BAR domain-containing protein n=1 Tax=Stentor coeruleus TaxID=5963 RepID=A0A1R2BXT9_9CILI|nr:hypothetical protein SteCoe_17886 [Stentor coeruleus]
MMRSTLELQMKLNDLKRAKSIAQNKIANARGAAKRNHFNSELRLITEDIETYQNLLNCLRELDNQPELYLPSLYRLYMEMSGFRG